MSDSALLLIGYQNDYFDAAGALHAALDPAVSSDELLERSCRVIQAALDRGVHVVSTPIHFTEDYSELVEPVGILAEIQRRRAFRAGSFGGATVPRLREFGDRLLELPGKRGLDAFSNTELESTLRQRGVRRLVLAGVVTSLCIDSTARSGVELGFDVTVLSDCTAGRTAFEREYYCTEILPMYAAVATAEEWLRAEAEATAG
ncbi:MAG: cysteine hydrolase family protein [Planctomycetota bacterium]